MCQLTEKKVRELPLGVQNFAELRKADLVYVDKTALIYNLVRAPKGFYFLSRPRRFGKTLLLSTLESLFRDGLKDFKGLAIEKLWTENKTYPVIHIDFSLCNSFESFEDFCQQFKEVLFDALDKSGIPLPDETLQNRTRSTMGFLNVALEQASELNPVLLIDEYDSPLNACIDRPELANRIATELVKFYTVIKAQSGSLRFFFMTGICKYRSLKIFSSGTFIEDISLDSDYSTLLGYTKQELLLYFRPYIENAAKEQHLSFDECLNEITHYYDGFCFDKDACNHVFVPWSTLNFLKKPKEGFDNYWYESGGQTEVLLNYIKDHALKKPEDYGKDQLVSYDDLRSSQELDKQNEIPLLTHTGYLTIKKRITKSLAAVNYPNAEVSESMAKLYGERILNAQSRGALNSCFLYDEPVEIVNKLNQIMLSIPYQDYPITKESSLRALLGCALAFSDLDPSFELMNALGRSDIEFACGERYFVIELKYARLNDKPELLLEQAISQVKEKHYGEQKYPGLKHIRMALVFSEKTRKFEASSIF